MKFAAFLVTLLVFTIFLLFANAVSFQRQNALDAKALYNLFKSFTIDTPCKPDDVGCIKGAFAKCHQTFNDKGDLVNTWAVTNCAVGTECYPLPLIKSRGVSIACDTRADFEDRINRGLNS